jgi:hypothetical protein
LIASRPCTYSFHWALKAVHAVGVVGVEVFEVELLDEA